MAPRRAFCEVRIRGEERNDSCAKSSKRVDKKSGFDMFKCNGLSTLLDKCPAGNGSAVVGGHRSWSGVKTGRGENSLKTTRSRGWLASETAGGVKRAHSSLTGERNARETKGR